MRRKHNPRGKEVYDMGDMILILPDEVLEARAKMKHIKTVAEITDADLLEPFILDEEHIVICGDSLSGQIACNATQEGYMVCPTGMPYTAPVSPAPKHYCTTAYASKAEEETAADPNTQT
jgi:hypothetical protein